MDLLRPQNLPNHVEKVREVEVGATKIFGEPLPDLSLVG